MDVKFKSNADETLRRFENGLKLALTAVGMRAEKYAKEDDNMPVDTGRARNSITYATKENEGSSFAYKDDKGNKFSDMRGTGAGEKSVFIGSNVEYFPVIELGGPHMSPRHVLKRAATDHGEEFKKVSLKAFESQL